MEISDIQQRFEGVGRKKRVEEFTKFVRLSLGAKGVV